MNDDMQEYEQEKEINRNDQTMVDACIRLEYGYDIIIACLLIFL
jgi:hypothetical protein